MLHRKKKAMEWLGETGKWTYGKKHECNIYTKLGEWIYAK